jgi:hypothetical protein
LNPDTLAARPGERLGVGIQHGRLTCPALVGP